MEYVITRTNNEDELMHYGVIGMKWGKRKASYYTDKANSHISKMNTSKTKLGKSLHNYQAYKNETKANMKKTMGEKGIRKTIDNVYGYGGIASEQKAAANYYNRKSTYSKSKLSATAAKSKSYNLSTAAKANTKLHNTKGVERAKARVDALMNRPIKTWSGRTTTTGKKALDNILTGGISGAVKDVSYYRKHRNDE